jgi:hypothetical protein
VRATRGPRPMTSSPHLNWCEGSSIPLVHHHQVIRSFLTSHRPTFQTSNERSIRKDHGTTFQCQHRDLDSQPLTHLTVKMIAQTPSTNTTTSKAFLDPSASPECLTTHVRDNGGRDLAAVTVRPPTDLYNTEIVLFHTRIQYAKSGHRQRAQFGLCEINKINDRIKDGGRGPGRSRQVVVVMPTALMPFTGWGGAKRSLLAGK